MKISGYQIVVFCCFSWYFRGVGDSGENCVRSVLVVRLHNFGQVGKGDAEMFRVGCRTCDPAAPHSTVHLPSCNSLFRPFATSGVTGLRLSGLPNLPFSLVLSFPPLSSNSLSFLFFLQFFFFSPLSLLPSLLLSPFFPQFSSIFPSSPLTSRFFQHFLVKPTCLSVTSLPTLCPARHLKQANATCSERGLLHISRHFWAHPKNEGPN